VRRYPYEAGIKVLRGKIKLQLAVFRIALPAITPSQCLASWAVYGGRKPKSDGLQFG
jgi:hypothetical protein